MSICSKHPGKFMLATFATIFIYKYVIRRFLRRKKRQTIIIQSIHDWNLHEKEILTTLSNTEAVGIDCEWVTQGNKRNPISLLQLADSNGFCVLIRLSRLPVWLMPTGLSKLLKDRDVLKVGVGVNDDAGKLFHDYCLEVQGFVDLRYLASDLKEMQGRPLGLKSLAKELLNYDMNKSFSLRCSDWDCETFSGEQIKYAADDAIISAKLYDSIKRRREGWFRFSKIDEDVEMYLDLPFKQASSSNSSANNASNKEKMITSLKNKGRYSKPRSRPMYDNCQLVAPDGELLCSCDRGKAQWYVDKDLGEVIKEEPLTVKLKFEPSGRPKLDNVFYTKEKSNCCVVCGETENYHRKLVVPSEYRKYFPDLMKKNLSHDVLLLCVNCHKRSNIIDHNMRVKLAELCDAPMMNSKNAKYLHNPKQVQVRSAATALHTSGHKIPEGRKKELEQLILDYFDESELTEELLQKALFVDTNTLNESFIPHGLKVYQYFCKNGGLIEFERLWRQHFLDTMKPKYLPAMWSVEHNHKRLALQVINNEREVNFDVSILGMDSELVKEAEIEAKKIPEENVYFNLESMIDYKL